MRCALSAHTRIEIARDEPTSWPTRPHAPMMSDTRCHMELPPKREVSRAGVASAHLCGDGLDRTLTTCRYKTYRAILARQFVFVQLRRTRDKKFVVLDTWQTR
jgi:hypothetical protein